MAKGKHRPAKGAVRPDKVLHPRSRKVRKLQTKEGRKAKLENMTKVGSARLISLGDKLLWFSDNLNVLDCTEESSGNTNNMTPNSFIKFIDAYLERFDDELETIRLKTSISKNRQFQHRGRLDAIEITRETEINEFNGCGLEVPDLLDEENLEYFRNWGGELRFIQNIKLAKYTRAALNKKNGEMDTE